MTSDTVSTAIAASSLAEVSWVADGEPQVRGVVPLLRGDQPTLAFTYADEAVARSVARSATVVLTLTETRSTSSAFRPLLLTGRPRLTEDPTGDLFAAELLVQELRRYPPARVFADSPLLMRENWWYLPRLVVSVDVERVEPFGAPEAERDHLLVIATGGRPTVCRAALPGGVHQPDAERIVLDVPRDVRTGPAVLFGQDASFPDLERWTQWHYRGSWDGDAFVVRQAPARTGVGRPLGLLQRWRRQRDLERRCIAAIPSS